MYQMILKKSRRYTESATKKRKEKTEKKATANINRQKHKRRNINIYSLTKNIL